MGIRVGVPHVAPMHAQQAGRCILCCSWPMAGGSFRELNVAVATLVGPRACSLRLACMRHLNSSHARPGQGSSERPLTDRVQQEEARHVVLSSHNCSQGAALHQKSGAAAGVTHSHTQQNFCMGLPSGRCVQYAALCAPQ